MIYKIKFSGIIHLGGMLMAQGIVSVVMTEEVLEKLDALAGKKGQSRSRTVNEILGDYFDLLPPQAKIDRVMEEIAGILAESHLLETLSKAKGSSLQCRGDIQYKYKPKVRYRLQLDGKSANKLATLHIVLRTQRAGFTRHLMDYFSLVQAVERADPEGFRLKGLVSEAFYYDGKKFSRDFYYPWQEEDLEPALISNFLGGYLMMLHEGMNRYFQVMEESKARRYRAVDSVYQESFRR